MTEWLQQNWAVVTTGALLAFRILECVVKVTKTDVDDKVVAIIKEFFKIG